MRFAICLYGQPRDYNAGYETIKKFIEDNKNSNTFDFFFHCWGDNNTLLNHSPWRNINTIYIENFETIKKDLIKLYNPRKYKFQKPIQKFDTNTIQQSIAYNNMSNIKKNNIHNTLSQIYSRNEVRNILNEYIEKTNTKYDMVISTRFDYNNKINLKLDNINDTKTYVSSSDRPRYILPDNFIVCPVQTYLEWFNLYNNLSNIINNNNLEIEIKKLNENLELNMEEYLLANYLYYYRIDDVIFSKEILRGLSSDTGYDNSYVIISAFIVIIIIFLFGILIRNELSHDKNKQIIID
jgi:hypothetical protein